MMLKYVEISNIHHHIQSLTYIIISEEVLYMIE